MKDTNGMQIEPSAAAAFLGLRLFGLDMQRRYPLATHIFWTTGGSFVPQEEYEKFYRRGEALDVR